MVQLDAGVHPTPPRQRGGSRTNNAVNVFTPVDATIGPWPPDADDPPGSRRRPGMRFRHVIDGIFDDRGRMMVILCHNNDLVDGWEREGEDEGFFRQFSERSSYPMGINIITYAMTH